MFFGPHKSRKGGKSDYCARVAEGNHEIWSGYSLMLRFLLQMRNKCPHAFCPIVAAEIE